MTRTRDQHRAARRSAARKAVLTALSTTVPELGTDAISTALETAGGARGIALGQLAEHLAHHPDALVSGDPRCPPVFVRLTHALHHAGHAVVVRPGCAGCGKVTPDLPRSGPGGRLCQMCAVHASLGTCARCGRPNTRIAARRTEGGICYSCYRTDAEVVEDCGHCGRTRMPVTRLEDGTPLCMECWTPPTHPCRLCGREAAASVSGPDGAICRDCYPTRRPRRPCGRCGRVRAISQRATDNSPDLCNSCNLGPNMTCAQCGRTRACRRYRPAGTWLCQSCKPRTSERCCRCDRIKPVHARWPIGALCTACHSRLLDAPSACSHCQQTHVLVAEDAAGAAICGPCARGRP